MADGVLPEIERLEASARDAAVGGSRDGSLGGVGRRTPESDYARLVVLADGAADELDVEAARSAVLARVCEERGNVRAMMVLMPVAICAVVLLSWLGSDEPFADSVWSAIAFFVGGSMVCCLAIRWWWGWYRSRAVRALSGDRAGLGGWLGADRRSGRREALVNLVCAVVLISIITPPFVMSIGDGVSWRSVVLGLFWIGVLLCTAVYSWRLLRRG